MDRKDLVLIILLAIAAILGFFRIAMQNSLGVENLKINAIEDKLTIFKQENAALKEELLIYKSLNFIEIEARKQGFVKAKYYFL